MEGVVRVTLRRILMFSQSHLAVCISLVSCMAALHTETPSALSLALGDRLPGTAICKSTALYIRGNERTLG